MTTKYFIFALLTGLLLIACSEIPFGAETADIALQINFDTRNHINGRQLSKTSTIQTVQVTVTGSDMETVTDNLDFDMDAGSATGTITVPQGLARNFLIEGSDQYGTVQFSGNSTADLEDDEVDLSVSVSWITPDPVTLSIIAYSYNSISLSWTASTAPDFGFYLPLVSTSPTLTLDNWWHDTTFTDVNKTTLTIDGLDEATTYYVTVIPVDTEGWFRGGDILTYSNSNTILRRVETPTLSWLYYDDGTFEDRVYSTNVGDRILTYFDPGTTCYVRSMWINLLDNSGVDENYTIVVLDANLNDILKTTPLPTYPGTNELIWKLPWSSRSAGTTNSAFFLGIEYQKTHGYPTIGFDQGTNSMSGYFTDAQTGTTTNLNSLGYSGNLGINALIEIGGSVDGDGLGKRNVELQAVQDNAEAYQFKSRTTAIESQAVITGSSMPHPGRGLKASR